MEEAASSKITNEERQERRILQLEILRAAQPKQQHIESQIQNIYVELNELEQESLCNDLEISGIPHFQNEDPRFKWNILARLIGAPPLNSTVTDVFWQNTQRRPGLLVLKFSDKSARQYWLANKKKLQEMTWPPYRVYPNYVASLGRFRFTENTRTINIYERLTNFNKNILHRTREAAKYLGFEWVWVKNGIILARQNYGSKVVRIRSELDIQQKMFQQSE